MKKKVLVTGIDDPVRLRLLLMGLKQAGWDAVSLPDMDAALEAFKGTSNEFNAVVVEHIAVEARKRAKEGLEFVRNLQNSHPEIPVIVLCNYASSKTLEEAAALAVTLVVSMANTEIIQSLPKQ